MTAQKSKNLLWVVWSMDYGWLSLINFVVFGKLAVTSDKKIAWKEKEKN